MLKLMFPVDGVLALCRDSLLDANSVDVGAGQGESQTEPGDGVAPALWRHKQNCIRSVCSVP